MDREEELLWLVLQQVCLQRGSQLRKLLTITQDSYPGSASGSYPDPAAILQASERRWKAAGAADEVCRALRSWRRGGHQCQSAQAAARQQACLRDCSAQILVLGSPAYPLLLAQIHDPPPLLYLRGSLPVLQQPQLAIVGSRKTTAAGKRAAAEFASAATAAGLSVASGLAVGIDGEAHRAALASGGSTVAVMATGIDRVYPRRHQSLAQAIGERGALVTEFVPGVEPRREQFPQRNRLISGLSMGVLVVEAALPSGSLITARMALEQGREVFALPHSIYHPQGRGCNDLLSQGAKLVRTAEDIFEELGPLYAFCTGTATKPSQQTLLSPVVERVYHALGYEPQSVASLVDHLGLEIALLMQALAELELRGMAQASSGCYLRC